MIRLRDSICAPSRLLGFVGVLTVLFSGSLAFSLLAFLTQVLLTRRLPLTDVGIAAALLAFVNFLTPIGTAGVNYFLLQSFGREGSAAIRWLPASVRLCAAAIACSAVAIVAYALTRGSPAITSGWLAMAALPILLGQIFVELASARLQLEERYSALSGWQGITQTGRFVVVVAITAVSATSLRGILAGYAMVGIATSVAGVALLRDLWRGRVRLQSTGQINAPPPGSISVRPNLAAATRQSLPFALMTLFYVLYFQGPIVTLEWLHGGTEAGIYNAAFLIIAAMSLIPTVIYMKFLLPKICRWAEHDRGAFRAAFHVGVPAMLFTGICLMTLILTCGSWGLPIMFGARYAAAVPALMILALSVPVRFVTAVYGSLFIVGPDLIRKVRYLGISAVAGTIASLFLVPSLGVNGAAIATVVAEVTLMFLHIVATARFIDGIDVTQTLRVTTFRASLRHLLQDHRSPV
jgi:O-antigen/teichoic acid export membrane protein